MRGGISEGDLDPPDTEADSEAVVHWVEGDRHWTFYKNTSPTGMVQYDPRLL